MIAPNPPLTFADAGDVGEKPFLVVLLGIVTALWWLGERCEEHRRGRNDANRPATSLRELCLLRQQFEQPSRGAPRTTNGTSDERPDGPP